MTETTEKPVMSPQELFNQLKPKCMYLVGEECGVSKLPAHPDAPKLCSYWKCPKILWFEWIHPHGVKILCDFGQCDNGSMLQCKKCKACLCLDHSVKHIRSCGSGMDAYARMRFEQEILDHKEWVE